MNALIFSGYTIWTSGSSLTSPLLKRCCPGITQVFNALDWLVRLVTHIPTRYEQTVRYYGWYSNKSRGMRKKANTDDAIPAVVPNEISSKESRQNWERLIQKV